MREFELIDFIKQHSHQNIDVVYGIGDDAAILAPRADRQLVFSTDTLIANTHFYPDISPYDLAYKALAVNLSDMAAMGAEPVWFSLVLSLPSIEKQWFTEFSNGLSVLASEYQLQCIGGDTAKGPLAITISAHGYVEAGRALRRDGAKTGDHVFVSGSLGGSALGLRLLQQEATQASPSATPGKPIDPDTQAHIPEDSEKPGLAGRSSQNEAWQTDAIHTHLHPIPQIKLGQALTGIASACLDISDGLVADLKHILNASNVGAKIYLDKIPYASVLEQVSLDERIELALSGGEDYQLCFTVPEEKLDAFLALPEANQCQEIGAITADSDLIILDEHDQPYYLSQEGFQHF